jgi:UDP-2-acetamido-2,6-beta-L-arabino-hexul-4-ose reductase
MRKVLITGSKGFIGSNLLYNLKFTDGFEVIEFDLENGRNELKSILKNVDFIFHLAGVNRPEIAEDFTKNNTELTQFIVDNLIDNKNFVPIVLSSSTQAELDNDYGKSKLEAENHILRYIKSGGTGYIYRLTNVFGKWCRPNYNSVVATFCYNIANGLEIKISDRDKKLLLIHIDDIIKEFKNILDGKAPENHNKFLSINPSNTITLGELADQLKTFKEMSTTLLIPDMNNDFLKKLHSTFLSYITPSDGIYSLTKQTDERGYLFELIKSNSFGQIFISKTKPGITRGNHFHHLKNEMFCVIEGKAMIKLRHLLTNEIREYAVDGQTPQVVNILPGYTHSITNTGSDELITLFWANEPFDKANPDTYFLKV